MEFMKYLPNKEILFIIFLSIYICCYSFPVYSSDECDQIKEEIEYISGNIRVIPWSKGKDIQKIVDKHKNEMDKLEKAKNILDWKLMESQNKLKGSLSQKQIVGKEILEIREELKKINRKINSKKYEIEIEKQAIETRYQRDEELFRKEIDELKVIFKKNCTKPTKKTNTYQKATNLPGMDYTSFIVTGPNKCRTACRRDPKCRAWTYVHPNIQGPEAMCWLKRGVPKAVKHNCCVSGVVER